MFKNLYLIGLIFFSFFFLWFTYTKKRGVYYLNVGCQQSKTSEFLLNFFFLVFIILCCICFFTGNYFIYYFILELTFFISLNFFLGYFFDEIKKKITYKHVKLFLVYFFFNICASIFILFGLVQLYFFFPDIFFYGSGIVVIPLETSSTSTFYFKDVGRVIFLNAGLLIKIGFLIVSFWILAIYQFLNYYSLNIFLVFLKYNYAVIYIFIFYNSEVSRYIWDVYSVTYNFYFMINYYIFIVTFIITFFILLNEKIIFRFFVLSSINRLSLIFLIFLCQTQLSFLFGSVFIITYFICVSWFIFTVDTLNDLLKCHFKDFTIHYISDLSCLKKIVDDYNKNITAVTTTSGLVQLNFFNIDSLYKNFIFGVINLLAIPGTSLFRCKLGSIFFLWQINLSSFGCFVIITIFGSAVYYFYRIYFSMFWAANDTNHIKLVGWKRTVFKFQNFRFGFFKLFTSNRYITNACNLTTKGENIVGEKNNLVFGIWNLWIVLFSVFVNFCILNPVIFLGAVILFL